MKKKFEEIALEWDGEKLVIPPDKVMLAISAVEDFVTLKELHEYALNPGSAKFAKLAMGYAAMLDQAGVSVGSDEVYLKMIAMEKDESSVLFAAVHGLLMLMVPSSALAAKATAGEREGQADAVATTGKRKTAGAKSSR